jgi:hypothetical protein
MGSHFLSSGGYEDWRVVAVSQTTIPQIGDLIEVILANPVMIEAYRAGVTGSNKHYPDGSKMAKIHWNVKQSAEAPTPRRRCAGGRTRPDLLVDLCDRMAREGAWQK